MQNKKEKCPAQIHQIITTHSENVKSVGTYWHSEQSVASQGNIIKNAVK